MFAPVWTTFFALLGVAGWLVWRAAPGPGGRPALALFAGQFALNVAWSAAFFGLQSPLIGLLVIAALWLAVVGTDTAVARVDRRVAILLVPSLAWVTFAAVLNDGFWRLD